MAGRPASRGGGLTGLHYGLITFVIVSVLGLGAFVWQLTQNKKLQDVADSAQTRLDEYGRPPEFYVIEARNRRTSVFKVMDEYLQGYATLVISTPELVFPSVKLQADRAIANAARAHEGMISPGDKLVNGFNRLSRLLADERRRATDLARQLAEEQRNVIDLTEQLKAVSEEFEAQVASLKERSDQVASQNEVALNEAVSSRDALEDNFDRATQTLQQMRIDLERGGQVKDKEVTRLLAMVEDLRQKMFELQPPGLDPREILTKADGKVLRAIPGSELVYVNVGEIDGLKVGMGFEVFSTAETPRGLRGKASVEIVNLMPRTAECRVTRTTPSHPIIEGDYIVNIAYERNRLPRFVVRGEFDLDYDGTTDSAGQDKVMSIIRQWGGQVVEELDETIDFVVVGTAPFVPDLPLGQRATPVIAEQVEERAMKRSEFNELIDRARATYIPVITQSQFLFLTGYYGDGLMGG